MYIQSPSFSKR
uniref:Uncharacterized protein n=2 Tax=Anguilla anguilla TaxID=7936 RepID=A0A0E9SUU2_ANGAN